MRPFLTRRQREAELIERLELLSANAHKAAAAERERVPEWKGDEEQAYGDILDAEAAIWAKAVILARNWLTPPRRPRRSA